MTLQLKKDKFEAFRKYLLDKNYEFQDRPYQHFLARGVDLVVSLYNSGKIVISGKNTPEKEKVEDFLRGLDAKEAGKKKKKKEYPSVEFQGTRIGSDESGKGDYFGPLVISGVLITEKEAHTLKVMGIQDSKALSHQQIMKYAKALRQMLPLSQRQVVCIGPKKYNELYRKMENVNSILGWGHARAMENLLASGIECERAVADKFGNEASINRALMQKGRKIELIQIPKGEREISVAAASILARDKFTWEMRQLGIKYGCEFPKGGGSEKLVEFGSEFIRKHGESELLKVAKVHFKTTRKII